MPLDLPEGVSVADMDLLICCIWIVVGFVLLVVGADWLVDGASDLAKRIGMPDRVIGLTIVSVGTSLPELVVSLSSATGGYSDMAFGNVTGSCLANLLLVLGLTALIQPIPLSRRSYRVEIPISIGATVLLLIFANTGNELSRWEGLILVIVFVLFLAETVYSGLKEGSATAIDSEVGEYDEYEEDYDYEEKGTIIAKLRPLFNKPRPPLIDVAIIAISVIMLKYGADFVVDNAVIVAEALGVSERVIGITVVAIGTCLPELAASVAAALRGNTDIAIGNIVGSNIANVLLVMGVPAMISPLPYETAYNLDFILLIVCSAVLVISAFICKKLQKRQRVNRILGLVYVMIYILYIMATSLA